MIPEGWSFKKLQDLARVERGKFSVRPRNDPKYYGGDIPFVQTGDIREAKGYLKSYTQTLNEEGLAVSKMFPCGTILITIAANIGEVAITTFDTACPDSVVGISTYKDTHAEWLLYTLQTLKPALQSLATQNAQANINLETLRPFQILTPPLEEQRKIAAILGTWDKAIGLVEALIAALQERKKGLMQLLLTGEVRFPEFDGEWEEVKLRDVAEINPRKPTGIHEGLEVSFVGMVDVSEDARLIHAEVKSYSDVSSGFTYFANKDVLVAKITPCFENGKGALVDNLENGIGFGSTEFHVLRARLNEVLPEYLYFHTVGYRFRKTGEQNMVGSAGQQRIRTDFVSSFKIPLPPLGEQRKITDVLNQQDETLDLLNQYNAELKAQKKGLMQQLLTGQVRV